MNLIIAKRIMVVCAAMTIIVTTTGCAVRTRLGTMIPGHVNSESLKGELVTATFIPLKEPATVQFIPGASEAAGAVVKIAVDTIHKELLREAEKFEHQSSTRLLVTTKDLNIGGVILITRWVDNPNVKKENASLESNEIDLVPHLTKQIYAPVAEEKLGDTIKTILLNENSTKTTSSTIIPPVAPAGKMAVAALTLRVTRVKSDGTEKSNETFIYRFSGAKLWVKAVGAKVVDFGWGNIPKIWQWPGALIFATDAQMGFTATMNTKALIATAIDAKNNMTEGKWVDILPESDALGSVNINLDQLPIVTPIGSQLGSWMMLPTIGGSIGIAVMNFKFTERDSSNAKKYIEHVAAGVKKNENTLSDFLNKAVGSDK